MIVRDEAHVVAEAIASVAPFLDAYVVVDTGSTDGTQDVVRRAFASHGVSGEVFERPWRDFGTNRTEALELCGRRADYVWVLDADDVLVGAPDLSGLTHDSYLLKIRSGVRFWRRQIFRTALRWAYRGVVHEYPVCLDPGADEVRLEGDYHVEARHLGSRSRAAGKWARDAALLRAALEADPSDARSAFYLAQSEQCAGNFRAALEANRRRAGMGGFAEEVFWSLVRAGECLEALGEPWEQVLAAYLAAWEFRPSRAEPLHRLARRCRLDGRRALAELFARRGRELPLPEGDRLFVEEHVYGRGFDDSPAASVPNGDPPVGGPVSSRPIRVKLLANWAGSEEISALWSRQSKGAGRWNDVELTQEDEGADYWAVVNHPAGAGGFRKDRTIVFQMEPSSSVAAWGAWASPDPREFLQVRTHARFPNPVEWHLGATWEELRRGPVEKTRTLSSVTSGKFEEPGHRLRVGFLKHLESRGVALDVFGSDNRHGLSGFRGSLPPHDKRAGIFPYRYTIAAENNAETNYATEKIWDAVLGECLCFYWGCPNLEELLDPEAFVRLPLEDVEESRRIVTSAIRDGERERRLPAILREKRRLLDEAQLFPSLSRTIHGHRLFESFDVRVVNLDRRKDRWDSFRAAALEAAGEAFLARCVRTPAVDGHALVLTPELRHLFRGNDFGDRRGIVACALSHLAIWREVARGCRACLVFEDDARLAEAFTGRCVELCGGLADAHPAFHIALLGYQLWDRRFDRVFHAEHLPPKAFPMEWKKYLGGTFAYVVSAEGARRLVALADRDGIQAAIDWFLMAKAGELEVLQAFPQIVSAPVVAPGTGADSDIQYDFAPVAPA
ncbi:MAG TPA: glycosyltransferase [Thermoanaerobaculia bacterium]|nr:glycosyltransferase [Thermoanaerobaculia bacterium]